MYISQRAGSKAEAVASVVWGGEGFIAPKFILSGSFTGKIERSNKISHIDFEKHISPPHIFVK